MHCTVAELLGRIGAEELIDWYLLERIEPWGQAREDWRAALVANTIARCHGNKTKVKDFLLHFEQPREEKPQSEAEILAIFQGLIEASKR